MELSPRSVGPSAIDLLKEVIMEKAIKKADVRLGEGKEHLLPYIEAECTKVVSLIETTLELEGVQERDPLPPVYVAEIRRHIRFIGFMAEKNARKQHDETAIVPRRAA